MSALMADDTCWIDAGLYQTARIRKRPIERWQQVFDTWLDAMINNDIYEDDA